MIINKEDILNPKTKDAVTILESGLEAARPENFLDQILLTDKIRVGNRLVDVSLYDHVYVVAVGKAAYSMAKSVLKKITVTKGIVVIPQTHGRVRPINKLVIICAGHPIPNRNSVRAAKAIITLLESAKKTDLVLFLVSGGASALISMPYVINLREKQHVTAELIKSGASIDEINAIRKHLSCVKGGRILEHRKCHAISLIMSDVVGDDLSSVGSGLTYCDRTSFADCMQIIRKYNLSGRIPSRALDVLRMGVLGKIPETPKKPKIRNFIVARNKDCLEAMKKTATRLGYRTDVFSGLQGPSDLAAEKIIKKFSFKKKRCLVFGGETTVFVQGNGRGGRNQELVLHVLHKAIKSSIVASIGTDGIDGNTKHAGAIHLTNSQGKETSSFLKNNDSHTFFKKYGGLIMTGPTHTNLMDVGLILCD